MVPSRQQRQRRQSSSSSSSSFRRKRSRLQYDYSCSTMDPSTSSGSRTFTTNRKRRMTTTTSSSSSSSSSSSISYNRGTSFSVLRRSLFFCILVSLQGYYYYHHYSDDCDHGTTTMMILKGVMAEKSSSSSTSSTTSSRHSKKKATATNIHPDDHHPSSTSPTKISSQQSSSSISSSSSTILYPSRHTTTRLSGYGSRHKYPPPPDDDDDITQYPVRLQLQETPGGLIITQIQSTTQQGHNNNNNNNTSSIHDTIDNHVDDDNNNTTTTATTTGGKPISIIIRRPRYWKDMIRVEYYVNQTTTTATIKSQQDGGKKKLKKNTQQQQNRKIPTSSSLSKHGKEGCQNNNNNNNNSTNTVDVEALVGVYTVPTGNVWVFVAKSKLVYASPGATQYRDGLPNDDGDHKNDNDNHPLIQIRRVEQLHMVHLPHDHDGDDNDVATTSPSSSSSERRRTSKQQRQEQIRQRSLWRQAWKDHAWYFCPRGTSLLPDMTRSLQAYFMAQSSCTIFNRKTNTNTTNTGTMETSSASSSSLPWYHTNSSQYPDTRFFWNEPILTQVLSPSSLSSSGSDRNDGINNRSARTQLLEWSVPLTSAFCGIQRNITIGLSQREKNNSSHIQYDHLLISRRSRFRAGTRFTKRGADAMGRVANYAETEQIIIRRSQQEQQEREPGLIVQSHVQIRGSIPLRWSSPTDIKTYRPRVRIGTDPVAQARSLQLHVAEQLAHYVPNLRNSEETNTKQQQQQSRKHPALVFVNLVDRKSDQGRLGRAMEAVLQAVMDVYSLSPDERMPAFNSKDIRHVWFDFHAELKGGRWDKLQSLLHELQPSVEEQGYFQASHQPSKGWKVEQWQTGIMRTNCMDCLDRTNVVQGILARRILVSQLKSVLPLSYKTLYRKNPLSLPWVEGEQAHRMLWADNADAISRLYAGTPALKGDFTRTGRRTKKGALDDGMNSLQRYYLNNFLDADRQEGIDLLTCHEEFNYLDDGDGDLDQRDADTDGLHTGGVNLKDAARQLLLGASWHDLMKSSPQDDDSDHVRIKVSNEDTMRKRQKKRELGLLWLPGDLQTQMRELVAVPMLDSVFDEIVSEPLLRAMDKRASSEIPWWIQATSSDESDTEDIIPLRRDADGTSSSPGFMLAALVASTQAPLATAALVLSIVGSTTISNNEV